jgi:hypothetical protein
MILLKYFFINKFKVEMHKLNIILIISFLIIQLSIVAQTTNSSNSSELILNSGLTFENEIEYCFKDTSCTATIQLINLNEKAQAIQFRLLINKAPDDSKILIFKDMQRGSDLSDPSWLMELNDAAEEEIFVLLYNANLDGGLSPGEYNNLLTVEYTVVHNANLKHDIKSSMIISHAEASTSKGDAIDIMPDRSELKIIVKGK